MTEHVLRYSAPAEYWVEALPLGNGRIGAMVFGDEAGLYQVTDDRCWSGSPASTDGLWSIDPDEGPEILARVRADLAAGRLARAEQESQLLQFGYVQAFQPLGDVLIPRQTGEGFVRTLNLNHGIAAQAWGDAREESFVSNPDGVMAIRRDDADVDFEIRSPHPIVAEQNSDDERVIAVRLPRRVLPPHGRVGAPVVYDETPGSSLTGVLLAQRLTDETGATIILVATAVDFGGAGVKPHGDVDRLMTEARSRVAVASARGWAELRRRHIDDVSQLMGRARLDVAGPDRADVDTDERLTAYAAGEADPRLAALAWQYGRYLLVSSSRPGTLPANLQGIWNRDVRPPWSSNFTTNINLEMNYWGAEVAGLSECASPLLSWIDDLAVSGERTARDLYGMRGWTAHHNSDAWVFSLPTGRGQDDPVWSLWPLAGAWLARHIWDRWDHTRDLDELADRWPTLRGAARFVLDWIRIEDGHALISPSTSPENHYLDGDGETRGLGTTTTADVAMVRDVLTNLSRAAEALGVADPILGEAQDALAALPHERTMPDGRLAEWSEDWADAEPDHRHQTHLYGLFPGEAFNAISDPELALASEATLDARGPHSTGWSLVWRMALRARLRDAAGAEAELKKFLHPVDPTTNTAASTSEPSGVYPNMFCAHPPFQIDGNLGVIAAISEMLVYSREGHLSLLPALPESLRAGGSLRGIRARGGIDIDLEWLDGRLVRATLTAVVDQSVRLEIEGESQTIELRAGEPRSIGE